MTGRHIYEFTVEELPEVLRAVHVAEPELAVEAACWEDLELACMVERTLRTWRLADQHRERERQEARA